MEKTDRTRKILAWALAACGCILLLRGLYGFCWSDESFYLTFAQRLWNGQKLILDEWHPVQFYSALTYPILSLYHLFFGTEGIYLFARAFYLALALAAALLLYGSLSPKIGPFPAFLCGLMPLLYSRGNIWGLSYYNLFVTLFVLSLCCFLRGQQPGKYRSALLVLSGFFLAGSVLCVPYFALFVLLGILAGLLYRPTRADFAWLLLGICLTAAAFLLFFLPKDIPAVLANLKEILSDPEHESGPLSNVLEALHEFSLLFRYESRELSRVLLCAALVLLGEWLLPKKLGPIPGLLLSLLFAADSCRRYRDMETGFQFFTLALFNLPGMLLCWTRRQLSVPALLVRICGAAMSLSMALSSNTGAVALTVGLPVYGIGLVWQLALLPGKRNAVRVAGLLLACGVLCISLYSRIHYVFRDGPISQLTVTMDQGPAKGIRTTPEHAEQYNQVLDMLEDLSGAYASDNSVFFTSLLPWGYLATDFPCGAPTAWRTRINSPRLESYAAAHDAPDIVVVLHEELGAFPGTETPNQNSFSGWLWEIMKDYQHLSYPCADVYISPDAD